ncbi:MAG: M48 family metalloprotease [Tepidisphaeraceae bacterium]
MRALETDRGLSVSVVNSGDAGGFSWRCGAIVVTRGLIDMLDDDELAAVIAHEMGHLHANHHIAPVASLKGCATDEDAETAADLIARELLDAAGVSSRALPRLLAKVAGQPGTAESCRRHLHSRIARLEAL